MYIKKIKVDKSHINGKGVFADEEIQQNEIVWIFKNGYDVRKGDEEFQKLPESERQHLSHTAYFSPWSGMWVYAPIGDAAEFTNHSATNNLSVKFDNEISSEPFFVTNRYINQGEELTNNYYEFDEITRKQKPDWASQ